MGAKGQGILLPDISIIGTFLGSAQGKLGTNTSGRLDLSGSGDLKLPEAELVMQGYLFPSIRADVVLSVHDAKAEIEEGYVSFLSFADGLSAKLGKERIDIGRLNKQHPHTWSFVSTPSVIENFIGELNGTGATLSYLFPLPFFLGLDVCGWKLEEPEAFGPRNFLASTKCLSSFSLGTKAELQIGFSGALGQGPESTNSTDNLKIAEVDLTFKLFPSAYSRFVFQNEGYALFREASSLSSGSYQRLGFYSFLGLKPSKEWEFGLRYDLSQGTAEIDTSFANKISAAATYWLSEASTFRLEYNYLLEQETHGLTFQFVFGLGPHTHPIK